MFSLGIFASCRLLPPVIVWAGVYYLFAGAVCLAFAQGDYALSPWAMGLPFGIGQLFTAALLYWTLERTHEQDRRRRLIIRADSPMKGWTGPFTKRPAWGSSRPWPPIPQGFLFNDLKDLCALTDGNLSRHLQILTEAGLIEVWKGFKNNRPQTLCRLTGEDASDFWNTSRCWSPW